MMSWRTHILLGTASLLVASLSCVGGGSNPVALTPVPQERSVPAATTADVKLSTMVPAAESAPTSAPVEATFTPVLDTNAGTSSSVQDKPDPSLPTPMQPTPNAGKDLTEAQYEAIDAQIAELRKSPDVLAECARENGDSVPAPGSAKELEWYAAAAIKYAACASSKTTGVDWRRK